MVGNIEKRYEKEAERRLKIGLKIEVRTVAIYLLEKTESTHLVRCLERNKKKSE